MPLKDVFHPKLKGQHKILYLGAILSIMDFFWSFISEKRDVCYSLHKMHRILKTEWI